MFDLILGDALPWILGIAASAIALIVAYVGGGSRVKNKQKLGDANRALNIKEKADEARENSSDDDRSDDSRLRDHDRLRD